MINGHIFTGQDFFKVNVPECDYIISNPPYSKKTEVFKKLYETGQQVPAGLCRRHDAAHSDGDAQSGFGEGDRRLPDVRTERSGRREGNAGRSSVAVWGFGIGLETRLQELTDAAGGDSCDIPCGRADG